MQLARYLSSAGTVAVAIVESDTLVPLSGAGGAAVTLTEILSAEQPEARANALRDSAAKPLPLAGAKLLAPLEQQEVWAAGVTYKRSKTARMEESESAATLYDRVYASARPELFFKATPHRVSGPGVPLRIRRDSLWNVPEPELALVLDARLRLVGCTVGNDMSSRDIEGENPLYLPQAKTYDACCGLGPWITLSTAMPRLEQTGIRMAVHRGELSAFSGRTDVAQMARSFDELIGWLRRDNSFPNGVILLTGTGVVPDSDFTLQPGDVVEITIDGIGMLSNPIVQS